MSPSINRWFFILPALLVFIGWASPGDFYTNLVTRILIASVFALSLNLLVGYGGLMSFCHAAFYGVAAYGVAWFSVKQGWGMVPAIIGSLLMVMALAAVFGLLALRAAGIGFMMITLALGQIVWGLAMRWVDVTGGENGIGGLKRPASILGLDVSDASGYFIFVSVVFLAICALLHRITRSAFGASLKGVRDQPRRMSALGFNVWLIRWATFVLSGLLAGVAGVLEVYFHKFVSPELLSLHTSAQVLLIVIVGGSTVLLGPVAGAVVIVLVTQVASVWVDRWTAVLGAMFVAIVLFMPQGVVPGLLQLWHRLAARGMPAAPRIDATLPQEGGAQ